ncbi:hypothetical protein [Saccharothrix syringae]|uniref:hypothetical protein n=1 Tax=Saccharothrix syringae TaxID=103733 RepID=UPI00052755C9|nr:hypothetical protein [Saccharothrix syringae]
MHRRRQSPDAVQVRLSPLLIESLPTEIVAEQSRVLLKPEHAAMAAARITDRAVRRASRTTR